MPKTHPMKELIISKFGTIKNFSEKVGIPYGVIINYIRMIRKPEPKRAKLIAQELGISVEELFGTYKVITNKVAPIEKKLGLRKIISYEGSEIKQPVKKESELKQPIEKELEELREKIQNLEDRLIKLEGLTEYCKYCGALKRPDPNSACEHSNSS